MYAFESDFEIRNTSHQDVQFILEPWGDEVNVKPGRTVRVGFRSNQIKTIDIEHQETRIVVNGWEDAEVTGIWLDGNLVG